MQQTPYKGPFIKEAESLGIKNPGKIKLLELLRLIYQRKHGNKHK